MSLQQWQAWIEKDNEVQTDVNVTQKKRKMRGRKRTYVCIKWDMTVMEMTSKLEAAGRREGAMKEKIMVVCSAFKCGPLP